MKIRRQRGHFACAGGAPPPRPPRPRPRPRPRAPRPFAPLPPPRAASSAGMPEDDGAEPGFTYFFLPAARFASSSFAAAIAALRATFSWRAAPSFALRLCGSPLDSFFAYFFARACARARSTSLWLPRVICYLKESCENEGARALAGRRPARRRPAWVEVVKWRRGRERGERVKRPGCVGDAVPDRRPSGHAAVVIEGTALASGIRRREVCTNRVGGTGRPPRLPTPSLRPSSLPQPFSSLLLPAGNLRRRLTRPPPRVSSRPLLLRCRPAARAPSDGSR